MTKKVFDQASGTVITVALSDPRPAIVERETTRKLHAELLPFAATVELEAIPAGAASGTPPTYRFTVCDESVFNRIDWETGEPYTMQLRMTPEAAQLQRARGGSIRDEHWGPQVGSSQSAEIAKRRLDVAGVRYLSGARAQEIEKGIQPQGGMPPILQNLSMSFWPIRQTEIMATPDKRKHVIVEEWEYVHTAHVADPAIPSVGVGRLSHEEVHEVPVRVLELSTREKENQMKKWVFDTATGSLMQVDLSDPRAAVNLSIVGDPPADQNSQDLDTGRGNGRRKNYTDAERDEIEELAGEAHLRDTEDGRKVLQGWLDQKLSPDRIGRELLALERTRAIAQPGPDRLVELSDKDAKRYRISNAALMQLGAIPKKGIEWDVHLQLKSEFPGANPNGGVLVPTRLRPQNLAIDAVTPGGGAELVQPGPIEFMDLMRVAPVTRKMGARFVPATAGSMPFVRRTGGAVAYFSATGTKKSASPKKFQIQEATPHRMVAVNDYSLEWLRTASLAVDAMMLQDAVDAHAPTWDWSALYGPGGADPLGLFKIAKGVNETDFDDKVPTSALLRECPRKVSDHEALSGSLGFIANGYLTDVLAETVRTSGAIDYILKDALGGDPDEYRFGNYRWRSSNQLGMTGSDYDGIFGAWQQLIFVGFGAMEIITNPYEKDTEGIVKVTVAQFVDTICRMPEAFTKFTGARLTNGT